MLVFSTLNDEDLKTIGVADEQDRGKILNFLEDIKSPEKHKTS